MRKLTHWVVLAVAVCLMGGGVAYATHSSDIKTITNDFQPENPEVVSENPEGAACMVVHFHTLLTGSSPGSMVKFTVTNAEGGVYTITVDPATNPPPLICTWISVKAEELGTEPNPNDPEGPPLPATAKVHVFWDTPTA